MRVKKMRRIFWKRPEVTRSFPSGPQCQGPSQMLVVYKQGTLRLHLGHIQQRSKSYTAKPSSDQSRTTKCSASGLIQLYTMRGNLDDAGKSREALVLKHSVESTRVPCTQSECNKTLARERGLRDHLRAVHHIGEAAVPRVPEAEQRSESTKRPYRKRALLM